MTEQIEMELPCDRTLSLDCDMVILEILTEKIVSDLGNVLKSINLYKKSITYLSDYNSKKEVLTHILL